MRKYEDMGILGYKDMRIYWRLQSEESCEVSGLGQGLSVAMLLVVYCSK